MMTAYVYRYGQPPKLTEAPVDDPEFTEFLDNNISKSTLDELQCKQTFKYIQQVGKEGKPIFRRVRYVLDDGIAII
jgi:hypothetical protein